MDNKNINFSGEKGKFFLYFFKKIFSNINDKEWEVIIKWSSDHYLLTNVFVGIHLVLYYLKKNKDFSDEQIVSFISNFFNVFHKKIGCRIKPIEEQKERDDDTMKIILDTLSGIEPSKDKLSRDQIIDYLMSENPFDIENFY